MFAKQLKKQRRYLFAAMFSITFIVLLNVEIEPPFFIWKRLENVSCYFSDSEDVLPTADSIEFESKSIFFHETSCKGGLDARQACAVESAARFHPDWDINVLFTSPGTKETLRNSSTLLDTFDNIHFYRIHVAKYAKGTPLEKFVERGALNRSRWPISHASDVMRYLTLYKWGGVYLDLDVVVAKPLGSLARNFAARESESSVSAGAMAFSRDAVGRRIAKDAIRDIKNNFKGTSWGHNGPGVITRVLKNMCSTSHINKMGALSCHGFEVYGPEYFYPVKWSEAQLYFKPGRIVTTKAYIYHVWNHLTKDLPMQRGSPYETLAKKYCPTVYNDHLDEMRLPKSLGRPIGLTIEQKTDKQGTRQ